VCLTFFVFSSCQVTKYSIQKMVQSGADPIVAACGLEFVAGNGQDFTLCTTRGGNEK